MQKFCRQRAYMPIKIQAFILVQLNFNSKSISNILIITFSYVLQKAPQSTGTYLTTQYILWHLANDLLICKSTWTDIALAQTADSCVLLLILYCICIHTFFVYLFSLKKWQFLVLTELALSQCPVQVRKKQQQSLCMTAVNLSDLNVEKAG